MPIRQGEAEVKREARKGRRLRVVGTEDEQNEKTEQQRWADYAQLLQNTQDTRFFTGYRETYHAGVGDAAFMDPRYIQYGEESLPYFFRGKKRVLNKADWVTAHTKALTAFENEIEVNVTSNGYLQGSAQDLRQ